MWESHGKAVFGVRMVPGKTTFKMYIEHKEIPRKAKWNSVSRKEGLGREVEVRILSGGI